MAESVFICLLGGIPGLALASLIVPGLGESVSFLSGTETSAAIIGQGIALAVLLGVAVGLPSSIKAMRLNIVDALRET